MWNPCTPSLLLPVRKAKSGPKWKLPFDGHSLGHWKTQQQWRWTQTTRCCFRLNYITSDLYQSHMFRFISIPQDGLVSSRDPMVNCGHQSSKKTLNCREMSLKARKQREATKEQEDSCACSGLLQSSTTPRPFLDQEQHQPRPTVQVPRENIAQLDRSEYVATINITKKY